MAATEDFLSTLIEVELSSPQSFLTICETLTRIGVASRLENRLFQSCHLFHKRNRYYLVSFKELFILDGKKKDFTTQDKGRRNTIALLLEQWGLLKILNRDNIGDERCPISQIKIVLFKNKADWKLESKHNLGKKPRTNRS